MNSVYIYIYIYIELSILINSKTNRYPSLLGEFPPLYTIGKGVAQYYYIL